MGYWKERLMEATEGGLNLFAAENKLVCLKCFTSEPLREVVRDHATDGACDFCERGSRIVAPLEEIVKFIDECLAEHYDDPANCLYHDSAEGGYQGSTYGSDEVLAETSFEDELTNPDGKLLAIIAEALGYDRVWCETAPYRHFCSVIKHERRFFSVRPRVRRVGVLDGDALLEPGEMLQTIVGAAISLDLVTTLSKGTPLYRARPQTAGASFSSALALGPPPPSVAVQSNRMSPPRIVMMYLAFDVETAIKEVMPVAPTPAVYATGTFELTRDVTILDLTAIPETPSIFDLAQARTRDSVIFLRDFERDVSKPIERTDRVNVEYIPTQVVTEYLRVDRRLKKSRILGMKYRSSHDPKRENLVLFGGRELLKVLAHEADQLEDIEKALAKRVKPCLRLASAAKLKR